MRHNLVNEDAIVSVQDLMDLLTDLVGPAANHGHVKPVRFENTGGGNYVVELGVNSADADNYLWISDDDGSFGYSELNGEMLSKQFYCCEYVWDEEEGCEIPDEESVHYLDGVNQLVDHLLALIEAAKR